MLTSWISQKLTLTIRSVKLIFICYLVVILASCVSTSHLSPGNPLPGIGLEATGDTILFSWVNDIPIARSLRPNTAVQVLAEYDTKYGKVTNEVVAQTRVRAGVNGLKLKLSDALKFENTGPVCLRLAVNRMPIPIRIATFEQSSNGFHYPEWKDNAQLASQKQSIIERGTNISINVQNFSKADPRFSNWQAETQIFSAQQCNDISVVTSSSRPVTAIQGQAKYNAAAEQCVALYKAHDYGDPPNYLPPIEQLINASQTNNKQRQAVLEMQKDFAKFPNGDIYFPYSRFPIDGALIQQIWGNKNLSESVAGLVIEAYDACKTEATTRFDESYNDWLAVSNPADVQARIEPLRHICKARFRRDSERKQRLAEFQRDKAELDKELAELNKQSSMRLPLQKVLIPFACKAENL